MFDRVPKVVLLAALVSVPMVLTYIAYTSPEYFTSQTYLAGLVFLEILIAAVWMYRRVFFPLIMLTFLLAGANVAVGSGWTTARWVTLGLGALIGSIVMLKERRHSWGSFDLIALFAVSSALVSAAVSRYASMSFSKTFSLLSLFIYAATGARLSVLGRENRFFSDLVTGCEILVIVVGLAHAIGIEVLGNPNSVGAVLGVAAAPILLWAALVAKERFERIRRGAIFVGCAYLIFISHARAGMVAAFLSCGLMCIAARKYKLLVEGLVVISIVVTASAILRPEAYSNTVSSLTNTVIFKGKDPSSGLLESRLSPWQQATESIQKHLWFGTGFGTSDKGQDATDHLVKFSTTAVSSTEFGSSYLAVLSWVGILGVGPFLLLLMILFKKIIGTVRWTLRTGNFNHPAVPLALVILAGLVHAGFEDWLFASGYYVTVFFWSMAFVFVDEAPSLVPVARRSILAPVMVHPNLNRIPASR